MSGIYHHIKLLLQFVMPNLITGELLFTLVFQDRGDNYLLELDAVMDCVELNQMKGGNNIF